MNRKVRKPRSEAIMWGRVRYNTGKPCKRGHNVERYTTNGACVQCVQDAAIKQQEDIAQAVREGSPKAAKMIRDAYSEKIRGEGGPWNAEQAVRAGLTWFAATDFLPCGHSTFKLDGVTCNKCGLVYDKEALDLLS